MNNIHFEISNGGETHQIVTRQNEYVNLMMLIYDQFAEEEFGECRGMGKCGTCMVELLNDSQELVGFDRNEATTLVKMNVNQQNIRLSCQLMIDEKLNGLRIKVL